MQLTHHADIRPANNVGAVSAIGNRPRAGQRLPLCGSYLAGDGVDAVLKPREQLLDGNGVAGRRHLRFERRAHFGELGLRRLHGALGFPRTDVLPVVPDFSHLAGPANFMQAGAFDDAWVNVLFVGRMIPNKRIDDVIRCFHAYNKWFNPRSRLLLVGSHAGF